MYFEIGKANEKNKMGEGFLSIKLLNIRKGLIIVEIPKCAKHFKKR